MTAATASPAARRAEAQRRVADAKEAFIRSVRDDPMASSFLHWVAAARDLDRLVAELAADQDDRITMPPPTSVPSFTDAVTIAITSAVQDIGLGGDWPPADG